MRWWCYRFFADARRETKMNRTDPSARVRPGEAAPDFTLPAVHHAGSVSLADYRGRSALLLAIFRGLYCPFCRRAVAQFGSASEKLQRSGVESLAVVATELENARLYFKYRPARVPIAADPALLTHRAFGLPQTALDDKAMQAIQQTKIDPTGELGKPMMILEAAQALDKLHGYQQTATDGRDLEKQGVQSSGQFLLDRAGIVRWANIECAAEGLTGWGKFPSDEELLAAVSKLPAR
jgi:peroxiredoxin